MDAKVINHFTEHLEVIHDNPPSFVITRWLQKHRTFPFPSAFLLDLTSLHATMTKCHIRQYSEGFFFPPILVFVQSVLTALDSLASFCTDKPCASLTTLVPAAEDLF